MGSLSTQTEISIGKILAIIYLSTGHQRDKFNALGCLAPLAMEWRLALGCPMIYLLHEIQQEVVGPIPN